MTTATETLSPSTFTICHIETPEGKKFLRKVIRENESLDSSESWSCRAHPGTDWKLEFRRIIKGEIGDPERFVTVMTDVLVYVDYRAGERQTFTDSKPVTLMGCTGVWVNRYDLNVLCSLLRHKNPRVCVTGHAGSSSSSQHGLSFYDLQVKTADLGGYVNIGNQTVAVNGRRVISGSVEI